jgi:hypothetical protein
MKRLGFGESRLKEAMEREVPLAETVDRFEAEFGAGDEAAKKIASEQVRLRGERDALRVQVREIACAGDVPEEAELIRVRASRDAGWRLLRRQWIDGEDIADEAKSYSPDAALPDAYERRVGLSDAIADRLRREADRVQKHAALQSRIEAVEASLSAIDEEAGKAAADLADTVRRWEALWRRSGIAPLSPREMRSWLSALDKLRFQAAEAEKSAAEIAERERERKALRENLIAALQSAGEIGTFPAEALAPLLNRAEGVLERIKNERAEREKRENRVREMGEALSTARENREDAGKKLTQWRERWKEALRPLGLGPGSTPTDANEFIETLKGVFDKIKEADELRKRIEGIDRDNRSFEKELAGLLTEIEPDLMRHEPAQAVSLLQGKVSEAGRNRAVVNEHRLEIKRLEKDLLRARAVLNANREQMSALLRAAGCEREEALDAAERRFCLYLDLREKLSENASTLGEIAEGIDISELGEQARCIDPDALPGRIEALSRELEGRDLELRTLSEAIGREKSEMKRMTGSGRAAELSDASQQILARIRRFTRHFIRVRLAAKILRDVIERYRAEHQDPVLRIASKYFRELTLDSFTDLRGDFDDSDAAILIGIRPDGSRIRVEGMSSGTRDQLYLALRLATLESRLGAFEPLPFVIDDILINFDDARAGAALTAFSALSEKIQIILFTHHRGIVETARALGGPRIFIHELEA